MSACVAAHRVWFRSSTSCDGHCSSLPAKSIGTFGPVPAGHCRLSENHLASVTPNTALSTLQSPSTPCCARHASASVRVTERGPASPHLGGGNRCRGTSGGTSPRDLPGTDENRRDLSRRSDHMPGRSVLARRPPRETRPTDRLTRRSAAGPSLVLGRGATIGLTWLPSGTLTNLRTRREPATHRDRDPSRQRSRPSAASGAVVSVHRGRL